MFYDTIKEVTEFYPEFVKYIATVDFSGNIKTRDSPVSGGSESVIYKKKSAPYFKPQQKNKSGKDKRQLHTLINYFNKSICLVSNGSGFFFLSVVVPSVRGKRSYTSLVAGTSNNLDLREPLKNKTKIKNII